MKNVTNNRRTRVTRLLIRRAFTELLRKKPIQDISVKELCERAGINRGTFYAVTLGEYGDKKFALRLIDLGRDFCLETYARLFRGVPKRQIEYFYAFASAGCIALLQKWLSDGMRESTEELAAMAEGIILHGAGFLYGAEH